MDNQKDIQEELEAIAPLLAGLAKKPVQSLPKGYFEQFSVNLPAEKAVVVKMQFLRKWMSYASAAVVAGILVTAAFVYTDRAKGISEFEQYSKMDIPSEMNKLSEEEMQNYLAGAVVLAGAGHSAVGVETEQATEEQGAEEEGTTATAVRIGQVSDEDLLEYLQENTGKIN